MVAPPLQASRAPDLFGEVKALGPHGEDAAGKLRAAYDDLVLHGATGDAQRLLAVNRAAERRDFPALERLVAGEQLLAELSDIEHNHVRRVVGWRNAAALVPLLVTWLFLGWASLSYHSELRSDPGLSTEPFLVLWQQRFGDRIIPTFAETALTAFILLTIVLWLTMRAHRLESRAVRTVADVSAKVDDAMDSLALAVQTSTVRPPATAQEWAEAAQRVLTETQEMIATAEAETQAMLAAAVSETRKLAEENNRITSAAQQAVAELHTQGRELIAALTGEVQATVVAIRKDNEQFIARTTTEATAVLQQAGKSNQQLVEQQMTPLFEGFRASLDDYRADQRIYRTSADAMAQGVAELTRAAAVLASSSQSYTGIAGSIDQHLRLIQASQNDFVGRVTENSASMTTAATAMREVTTLMTGNLKSDLEQLARNVVDASTQLAAVDRQLAAASGAIASTTSALQAAARSINVATAARRATPPPPRGWNPFRRS